MKKKIFIIVCAFCVWVVGGCGDKSISSKTETQENINSLEDEAVNGEINLKSEDFKKSDGEIYWWHVDLTNDGIDEEIQKKSNEVKFDVFKQEEHDIENIMAFADEVNSYMKKSFILVDTNGGKQIYSTHENKIEPVFDPTELINEMKKMREDSISDIE